jgi:hypothetical protein
MRASTPPTRSPRAPATCCAHWTDPGLILSQTCGRPYKAHLHGQVRLVGTPDYGLRAARPGHYQSLVIARADDPRAELATPSASDASPSTTRLPIRLGRAGRRSARGPARPPCPDRQPPRLDPRRARGPRRFRRHRRCHLPPPLRGFGNDGPQDHPRHRAAPRPAADHQARRRTPPRSSASPARSPRSTQADRDAPRPARSDPDSGRGLSRAARSLGIVGFPGTAPP